MSEYVSRLDNIREDPLQRAVFDEDISRVVIAGPGSGKTFLLTAKVAKLLFSGAVRAPQRILCLTYSRLLENQLRLELTSLAYLDPARIFVGTVHGFCLSQVIAPFRRLYGLEHPEPLRIASWEEMLEAIRIGVSMQELEPSSRRTDIEDLARDLGKYRKLHWGSGSVDFDECSEYGRTLESSLDWFKLSSDYVEILTKGRCAPPSLDFVQIEIDTLRLIKEQALVRQSLAASFPWWFIDEYQDLGRAFHEMISCLVERTDIKILAIGDPDQCVYEELQGSKPEFIHELTDKLEESTGLESVTLNRNYRCAQEIIDLSKVMLGEQRDYQSGLNERGHIYSIHLVGNKSNVEVMLIQRLLHRLTRAEQGPRLNLSEVAILHPYRKGLASIEEQLDPADWPCTLDKYPEYNRSVELIEWIESLAKSCVSGLEEPAFSQLLVKWKELNEPHLPTAINANEFRLEKRLFDALWDLQFPEMLFSSWLVKLTDSLRLEELLEYYATTRPDEVKEFTRLQEAAQSSQRISNWTLAKFAGLGDRIQLTTLHSCKGSQFEAVIIAGFDQIVFWKRQEATPLERRLAYVATTRAKRYLYLLHKQSSKFFVDLLLQSAPKAVEFFSYDGQTVASTAPN